PQLQVQWQDDEGANQMGYQRTKTQEIITKLQQTGGVLSRFSDFLHSSGYLEAVRVGCIKDTDMVLMLSMDGAQLYEHKTSDCWIYIWIILDLAPNLCYKKRCPSWWFFPGKPKFVNSFLFPGLHQHSALQQEGLWVWDASQDKVFVSKP
ncbi:hypothetical protein L208DRAFT_1194229, partial [Tricholoma matsutake]